jgi:F-type H+-transporting ATPase subunit delta
MYQQVIARRYARGFLQSVPKNEQAAVLAELHDLCGFLGKDGDFYKLLTDPAFSPLEKKAVINRMAEVFGLNETLKNFLLLLIEKGRASLLALIYESLQTQMDEQNGLVRAQVLSATAVDENFLSQIKGALSKLRGKDVLVSTKVEPKLLGGVKVDMDGMIFDGTIRARLDAIRSQLLN